MYSFVKNKSLIKNIESFGSTLIKDLIKRINKQKYIRVQKELFGSGSEELIVQNDKGVIIIDYNLIVYAFFEGNSLYDCKKIREFVKKNFDESLTQFGCEISKDHSLSLAAENLTIDDYKDTPFIINLNIVFEFGPEYWIQLAHFKKSDAKKERWFWYNVPNTNSLMKRVEECKECDLWKDVQNIYLEKMNDFSKIFNRNADWFYCYAAAITEVENKNSDYDGED